MNKRAIAALCLGLVGLAAEMQARVVINEIFYNAPGDLDDLEYVELYNTGTTAADLSGWKLTKGIKFEFPAGTRLDAGGFLVICRNAARFKEFYEAPAAGEFQQALSNKGERIELADAAGQTVDAVRYKDDPPWPQGADGESGSLERIAPEAGGEDPANWISSPLSPDRDRPAGTPGRPNAGFSAQLPPVISAVTWDPQQPGTNQAVTVTAELRETPTVTEVRLVYQSLGPADPAPETVVRMERTQGGKYVAALPGQAAGRLVRFRVEAAGTGGGALRRHPAVTEPRPAHSYYVAGPVEAAQIPVAWILQATSGDASAVRRRGGGPGMDGPDPAEMARFQAQFLVERGLDLAGAWFELTVRTESDLEQLRRLRPVVAAVGQERDRVLDDLEEAENIQERLGTLPAVVEKLRAGLAEGLKPHLNAAQNRALEAWLERQRQPMERRFGPQMMVTMRVDVESVWYAVSVEAEPDATRLKELRGVLREIDGARAALVAEVASGRQQETGFREVREQADDLASKLGERLPPLLTAAQAAAFESVRNAPGPFRGGPGRGPGRGGRAAAPAAGAGGSIGGPAFVYYDPATQRTELFDFVRVGPRKGGLKVRFHGDQPLQGMTTINLLFEGDLSVLAEPLAYEVYRRAGMAAEQSHHLRLSVNGEAAGYQLLVEQPNRGFLRRNKIRDDGRLYKLLWYEQGVAGQHEAKTRTREGHDDIVGLVRQLEASSGDAQWEVIRKNFDVEQVATYFAVNMVLSHWDGFFNNYFTYHDDRGTGKWTMYPWDQDQTWGIVGMGMWGPVFFDMPTTFGMNGDVPPGETPGRGRGARPGGGFGFGGGPMWWRGPGWFSGPLLANPRFRPLFLARTKEILETVYTEAAFGPVIDAMGERLKPEVRLRAELFKFDPAEALATHERNLRSLREHLTKRREFLLAQPEVKNAGRFSRDGL